MLAGLFSLKTRQLCISMLAWVLLMIGFSQLYRLNIPLLAFVNITAVLLALYLAFGIGVGILWFILFEESKKTISKRFRPFVIGMVILTSYFTFYMRTNDFLEARAFMTQEDELAMEWVKVNTSPDDVFGVNTSFVNPVMPYGTDAGYWLPVYAERRTTTMTLLASLSDDFVFELERSKTISELYKTNSIEALCAYGVDYLYSGVKKPLGSQDFSLIPGFEDLINVDKVYENDGVQIYKICEN